MNAAVQNRMLAFDALVISSNAGIVIARNDDADLQLDFESYVQVFVFSLPFGKILVNVVNASARRCWCNTDADGEEIKP